MDMWDEEFSKGYDEWTKDVTDDIPFYVDLAKEAAGPIVELGIGTGRVAIPVAQATGRRIIGIDVSPSMLRQAEDSATAAGVDLDLRQGDVVELDLEEPASLIYSPGRSLLHVPTWAQRRRLFERVAANLLPGGRFAWNAFAFDHRFAAELDGKLQAEPEPHRITYDVPENRIDLTKESGAAISVVWGTKNEWLGLIDVAGLEIDALYGDFDRSPLTPESREYVFVTRRAA